MCSCTSPRSTCRASRPCVRVRKWSSRSSRAPRALRPPTSAAPSPRERRQTKKGGPSGPPFFFLTPFFLHPLHRVRRLGRDHEFHDILGPQTLVFQVTRQAVDQVEAQ